MDPPPGTEDERLHNAYSLYMEEALGLLLAKKMEAVATQQGMEALSDAGIVNWKKINHLKNHVMRREFLCKFVEKAVATNELAKILLDVKKKMASEKECNIQNIKDCLDARFSSIILSLGDQNEKRGDMGQPPSAQRVASLTEKLNNYVDKLQKKGKIGKDSTTSEFLVKAKTALTQLIEENQKFLSELQKDRKQEEDALEATSRMISQKAMERENNGDEDGEESYSVFQSNSTLGN